MTPPLKNIYCCEDPQSALKIPTDPMKYDSTNRKGRMILPQLHGKLRLSCSQGKLGKL